MVCPLARTRCLKSVLRFCCVVVSENENSECEAVLRFLSNTDVHGVPSRTACVYSHTVYSECVVYIGDCRIVPSILCFMGCGMHFAVSCHFACLTLRHHFASHRCNIGPSPVRFAPSFLLFNEDPPSDAFVGVEGGLEQLSMAPRLLSVQWHGIWRTLLRNGLATN